MYRCIFGTTSLLTLTALLSAPVFADVTPEEVWQNWQSYGNSFGQKFTAGSENREGDTLTITDLKIEMGQKGEDVSGTIPEVAFRDTGDGKVDITMSEEYLVTFAMKNAMDKPSTFTLNIAQNGMTMTASGTPDAVSYDFSADSFELNALDFTADGKPKEMDIDVTLADVAGTYNVSPGDKINVASTFSAQSMTLEASGKGDTDAATFSASAEMNNLAGGSSSTMPKDAPKGDMTALLALGFTTDASFTYDSGNLSFEGVDEAGTKTSIDTTSEGGSLKVALDQSRISYGATGKTVTISGESSALPIPGLSAAYDEATINFSLPMAKAAEPQDFAFETRLQGLTVSDTIWGMVDPGKTLPRDPANLVITTTGKATPLVDLITEDAAAMAGDKAPFQLNAVNLDALNVSVAGAELTGDGALTFDNTQPPLMGGVAPMPVGKINVSLTGANTLLGKLQALGLVDPQIVMTFGMMSGMLAKPGPTPDSLVSEVEFQEGGKILTNGNPLPF
ncbi:DUF2125 domain-containing protein [Pseudorhodobacter sp.]|uniref:DUF2125 domain-containing protein n=1 Tax=Pseudorhodobacter sp. TaxID=1934400 RepID=UPI002648C644|nr:DUF2125 domain-containing protein [Pseudorhodobacter sp.]MDN5785932.1 DUF2125 domain-containing protein [Pseudorhodobacter sp.]